MKTFNEEEFPNLLDNIDLTYSSIEDILKEYPLEFSSIRNQMVEWRLSLPMFATAFYKCIYFTKSIPNQKQFYEYYLSSNKEYFDRHNFADDIYEGIRARVYRAYPSLVRDIHFSKMLYEKLNDYKVIYNTRLDTDEGVDVMLKTESQYYGVNLFTNTSRAKASREKKSKRHTNFSNVSYLDLPVNFNGSKKCGDFFLYSEEEINELLDKIKQND